MGEAERAFTPTEAATQGSSGFAAKPVVPQRGDAAGTVVPFAPRSFVRPSEAAPQTDAGQIALADDLPPAADVDLPPQPEAVSGFVAAPEPEMLDVAAEVEAGRKAGYDEGYAKARAEFEAMLEAARAEAAAAARESAEAALAETSETLGAVLTGLMRAEAEIVAEITAMLDPAIRELASKRAGIAIEETPRPFLKKIEALAKDVAGSAARTELHMNPGDLVAVREHIRKWSPLTDAQLVPDPKLGRGDVRLVAGDITLSDVIAPREKGSLA